MEKLHVAFLLWKQMKILLIFPIMEINLVAYFRCYGNKIQLSPLFLLYEKLTFYSFLCGETNKKSSFSFSHYGKLTFCSLCYGNK